MTFDPPDVLRVMACLGAAERGEVEERGPEAGASPQDKSRKRTRDLEEEPAAKRHEVSRSPC